MYAEEERVGGCESQVGDASVQVMRRCLREREGEVKALAKALESQKGVRWEVARGHFTVRLLVATRRTVALKAPDQEVDTGTAVFADSRRTASRAGR